MILKSIESVCAHFFVTFVLSNTYNMKQYLLTILASTCSITTFYSQQTIELQPDPIAGKDTYIHGTSGYMNDNFGDVNQLPVTSWTFSSTPGTIRSLVQFDYSQIPAGAQILNAELSLYAIDSQVGHGQHSTLSGSNSAWIERITSPWNESTVSWNTQPATTTLNRVALTASVSQTQNYTGIDVTNLVEDMLNSSSNFGFMIKLQTEEYYRRLNFCSSDHTNGLLRPKLIISYTLEQPDSCITLKPNGSSGKDAYIHGTSGYMDVNFGNGNELPVTSWTFSGTPGTIRSLVQFDYSQIPANAQIQSAELSLYAMDTQAGQGQHSTLSGSNSAWIERITSPWDELSVTWNTQPTTTTVNRIEIDASVSQTQNYTGIDVTNLVEDMFTFPSSSFGFMLKLQTEEYYRRLNFCSSDHPNELLRPELEVCFSVPLNTINIEQSRPELHVFPNPAKDVLFINTSFLTDSQSIKYVIFDTNGKHLQTGDIEGSSIDTSELNSGIYLLQIETDESLNTVRFVKE